MPPTRMIRSRPFDGGKKVLVPMKNAIKQLLVGLHNDYPYYYDLFEAEVCSEYESIRRRMLIFDEYLDLSDFSDDREFLLSRLQKSGKIRSIDMKILLRAGEGLVAGENELFKADDLAALRKPGVAEEKIAAFLKLMCCFQAYVKAHEGEAPRLINYIGYNDLLAIVGMTAEYNSAVAHEIKTAGYRVKEISLAPERKVRVRQSLTRV